jgi:hypothetical protein
MVAEDFIMAFLARMVAPTGFTAQEFMKDLGEGLMLEGALQSHEWTVASPSRVQRSFLSGKLADLQGFDWAQFLAGADNAVDEWWGTHGMRLAQLVTAALRAAGEAPEAKVASKYSSEMARGQILTGAEVDALLGWPTSGQQCATRARSAAAG